LFNAPLAIIDAALAVIKGNFKPPFFSQYASSSLKSTPCVFSKSPYANRRASAHDSHVAPPEDARKHHSHLDRALSMVLCHINGLSRDMTASFAASARAAYAPRPERAVAPMKNASSAPYVGTLFDASVRCERASDRRARAREALAHRRAAARMRSRSATRSAAPRARALDD
jgi:hypothetical protein